MPQGWKQQKIVIKVFQNIRELWTLAGSEGILLFTIYCIKFSFHQIRNWFLSLSLFNLTPWLTQEKQLHKSRGHLWIFFFFFPCQPLLGLNVHLSVILISQDTNNNISVLGLTFPLPGGKLSL